MNNKTTSAKRPTVHAATNYRALKPFLDAVDAADEKHRRFISGGYMPLCMEYLYYTDHRGFPVYSIAHYGEQNGDLMRDPDMTFSVDRENGYIHPLSYQNDYIGVYRPVYKEFNGQRYISKRELNDEDAFLWTWTKNIIAQGFSPDVTE